MALQIKEIEAQCMVEGKQANRMSPKFIQVTTASARTRQY